MNVSRNLRYYRELRGYSRRQLSIKTGISHETIKRCEDGNNNLNLTTAIKLADALRLTLDDLADRNTYVKESFELLREISPTPWHFVNTTLDCYVVDKNNKKIFGGELNEGYVSPQDSDVLALVRLINTLSEVYK